MSTLLPEGITHLGDCPYTLHQAIVNALRILSYEEWPSDERPPKRIWFDADALDAHWKAHAERQKRATTPETDDDENVQFNNVELIKGG